MVFLSSKSSIPSDTPLGYILRNWNPFNPDRSYASFPRLLLCNTVGLVGSLTRKVHKNPLWPGLCDTVPKHWSVHSPLGGLRTALSLPSTLQSTINSAASGSSTSVNVMSPVLSCSLCPPPHPPLVNRLVFFPPTKSENKHLFICPSWATLGPGVLFLLSGLLSTSSLTGGPSPLRFHLPLLLFLHQPAWGWQSLVLYQPLCLWCHWLLLLLSSLQGEKSTPSCWATSFWGPNWSTSQISVKGPKGFLGLKPPLQNFPWVPQVTLIVGNTLIDFSGFKGHIFCIKANSSLLI